MLNCKKIASVVLALALVAGLFGCAGHTQSSEVESGISGENSAVSAVSNEIVSSEITSNEVTSAVEYIPQDRFEDANIINTEFTREKLSQTVVSAESADSYSWEKRFVMENYKVFMPFSVSVTPKDESRFMLFSGHEECNFYTETFFIRFKAVTVPNGLEKDADGFYCFYLQTAVKLGKENVFLGFVTSQTDQIVTSEDLIEFLSVIPEYHDLRTTQKPLGPQGPIESVNLRELTGGLAVSEALPIGRVLYVFGHPAEESEQESDLILKAFSTSDFHFLYEYAFPSDIYKYYNITADSDSVIIAPDEKKGGSYYRATENGVITLYSKPAEEEPEHTFRLSDSAVISESGYSLLLEKGGVSIPIFTGGHFENEEHPYDIIYRFHYRINDHSFIYTKDYSSYFEWYKRDCGIYNIETGENTLITYPDVYTLIPIRLACGKLVLIGDTCNDFPTYGPFLYDLSSGEIKNLNWLGKISYSWQSIIEGEIFGNTLVVVSKDHVGFVFYLYDLTQQTEQKVYCVLLPANNSLWTCSLSVESGYLWLTTGAETEEEDIYVYRMPFEG